MGIFIAIWVVCLVIAGLSLMGAWLRLQDDNEKDLPLTSRRSWQIFQIRQPPWTILREHRRRYPEAKMIRFWAILTLCVEAVVLYAPFLIALLRQTN